VGLQEQQRLPAGLVQRDRRGLDRRGESRSGMHRPHEVVHSFEFAGSGVNDDIRPLRDHLQLVVGDHRGNLDDHVPCRVETGHLQVHPGEHQRIVA